jgi:hypothetical protein
MVNSQYEFVLLPSRRDALSKPLKITPQEWQAALALSKKHGYTVGDRAFLSREMVRWLRRSLEKALESTTDAAEREQIERLVRFCLGDAATGFSLERRWRRAI